MPKPKPTIPLSDAEELAKEILEDSQLVGLYMPVCDLWTAANALELAAAGCTPGSPLQHQANQLAASLRALVGKYHLLPVWAQHPDGLDGATID